MKITKSELKEMINEAVQEALNKRKSIIETKKVKWSYKDLVQYLKDTKAENSTISDNEIDILAQYLIDSYAEEYGYDYLNRTPLENLDIDSMLEAGSDRIVRIADKYWGFDDEDNDDDIDESLNESYPEEFKEVVADSYQHFTKDLGRTPTISELLDDITDNYEGYEDIQDTQESTDKWYSAISVEVAKAGFDVLDESLNEGTQKTNSSTYPPKIQAAIDQVKKGETVTYPSADALFKDLKR